MTNKPKLIEGLDYWSAFGQRLTDLIKFKEGTKVLDIGTGEGGCLIPAAKKIGSNGKIIGIDRWPNFIEEATENIKKNFLTNAYLEIMDARELTFDDSTFDYTICGFIGFSGIFDFQNNEYKSDNTIMKQILRVLKPQGKAGFSTWLLQEELKCLGELIREYLKKYTSSPQVEINKVPVSYSKESIDGFKKIMLDVGFKKVDVFSEDFFLKYDTFDDWFDMMRQVGWILEHELKSDDKIQDFIEKMLPHGLTPYKKKDGYYFTKKVIFAFGEK
ncbi:MAG: methyltransferase domain-containing protein [Asgard group archaeon]|nr:methyltransferase domain-containing protein [Asgard group archaeon]